VNARSFLFLFFIHFIFWKRTREREEKKERRIIVIDLAEMMRFLSIVLNLILCACIVVIC